MKLTALLNAIERDVAGIDAGHDLLWSRSVSVNEWLEEYAGEPSRITTAGPVLHATQCRRGAEQLVATERGLQDRVVSQAVVIARTLVVTAKRIQALRNQALHRVFDQIGVARINHRSGSRSRQTELLVERFE